MVYTTDWKLETFLLKIASVTEIIDFIAQIVRKMLETWGISLNSVIVALAMQCCDQTTT